MLTTSADEALNTGISLCALGGLKASGDFLLCFGRSDVSFRLIVAERNDFILSECQYSIAVFDQAIQQAKGFTPCFTSSFFFCPS